MAQKRMFSLEVVETDSFLDMPTSSQALYFHLGMHGDDEGFVSSPNKIMRASGCNRDDMNVLIAKGFIIPFDSGVVVIRDWSINNYIQADRYHPTIHTTEKALLTRDNAKRYVTVSKMDTACIQPVSNLEAQIRLDKSSIDESSIDKADKPPRTRFVAPTVKDVAAYCQERRNNVDPQRFVDYYTANGWTQGRGKPIKDWRAAVRTWEGSSRDTKHEQPDLSWRNVRSTSPEDLVEYPSGSGQYIPRWEVPHG